ncbi:MAG: MFS transporter [Deltaproteobacteria bacterium]|nr:MFS transporter [Deltaproteobacteria bacterium]
MQSAQSRQGLISFGFIVLSLVCFLAFCNISIFYGFNVYMERIGVSPEWRGLLLGLESAAALVFRPIISPFLTPRNGLRAAGLGLGLVMAALTSYQWAEGLWGLAVVRMVHGLGFVLLISAVVAVMVIFIPQGRSGQAFGVFAVTSLLPYAVLPPLVERLLPLVGNEAHVYAMAAPLLLPAMLLLWPLGMRVRRMIRFLPSRATARPGFGEIAAGLRAPGVSRLLVANFLFYTSTTVVFFYMKNHLQELNAGNPGLFFSISTGATIFVRVVCGALLDRGNKATLLAIFLGLLALCMVLFALASQPDFILALAAVYGICLGFIFPLFSSAMFDVSPQHLRGVNTNVMLSAMDGGYVLGPVLAGMFLAYGLESSELFFVFAVLPVLAALVVRSLIGSILRESSA